MLLTQKVPKFWNLASLAASYLKVAMRHTCVILFGLKWLRWAKSDFLALAHQHVLLTQKVPEAKVLG